MYLLFAYYLMMATITMVFVMGVMCGHCYDIDTSWLEYGTNIAIQGLLWPITMPILLIRGNPTLLLKFHKGRKALYGTPVEAITMKH